MEARANLHVCWECIIRYSVWQGVAVFNSVLQCCSVLQCAPTTYRSTEARADPHVCWERIIRCSVLQCVAVFSSVLQCCSVLQCAPTIYRSMQARANPHVCWEHIIRCSMLQCVAVFSSLLQRVAACCSVRLLHTNQWRHALIRTCAGSASCVAACCSTLQCVAVSELRFRRRGAGASRQGQLHIVCLLHTDRWRHALIREFALGAHLVLQRVAVCCSVLQCVIWCAY